MIYTHSIGRALRNFPDRSALISETDHVTFRELHERSAGIARALRPARSPFRILSCPKVELGKFSNDYCK
jgi:hypothetical protein